MFKVLDYIMTFFMYLMLVLWVVGTGLLFALEMIIMLPFVLIEEACKQLKKILNNKKEPLK